MDDGCFRPVALAVPALVAINDVAILAPQPPLSPPAPPGEKGEPTALCGRVLEVDKFTVRRQPSKPPSTAVCGRVFKGGEFIVRRQLSK